MLADWLSEDGRKAIEKMGWPEWCDEPRRRLYNVLGNDWEIQAESDAGFDHLEYIDGGVALALLRDRAREWLEENTDGWSGGLSSGGYSIETCDANSNKWTLHSTPESDWDGCLILAILATEK